MNSEDKKKLAIAAGFAGGAVGTYGALKNYGVAKLNERLADMVDLKVPSTHLENIEATAILRMRGKSLKQKKAIAKAVRKMRKMFGTAFLPDPSEATAILRMRGKSLKQKKATAKAVRKMRKMFGTAFLPDPSPDEGAKVLAIMNRIAAKQKKQYLDAAEAATRAAQRSAIGAVASITGGLLLGNYLEKQSQDDTDKEIATKIVEERAKALPFIAAGLYGAGEVAHRIAPAVARAANEYELIARKHMAEANRLNEKIKGLLERAEATTDPKEREAIKRAIARYEKKIASHTTVSGIIGTMVLRSGGSALADMATSFKYAAIPTAILGAYHYGSKALGGKGISGEGSDPGKLRTAANVATLVGAGLLGKALWRPVIKPLMRQMSGEVKKVELPTNPEVKIDTMKDRIDAASKALKASMESTEKIKDSSMVSDAKLGAIGASLMASGVTLKYVLPTKTEIAQAKAKLHKQASFLMDGALAHLLQNSIIKGRLHSGAMYQKAAKHLIEGNSGRVYKNKLSALGDGFYSGTVDPDAKVLRKELREMGASLKSAGVDFANLSNDDKAALYAIRKGRVDMLAALVPKSRLARYVIVGDEKMHNAAVSAAIERALSSIPADKWEDINKQFSNSVIRKIVLAAKDSTAADVYGYVPARDYWLATDALNAANKTAHKNALLKNVLDFLGKDVDDVFRLKKQPMTLEEAEKLEEKGRMAGLATSLLIEPAIGAWNYIKPKISDTKLAQMYAKYSYGYHTALGASGHQFDRVSLAKLLTDRQKAKEYAGGAVSDYILSPTLGMTNRMMYDIGSIGHKILKSGLKPEEYDALINGMRIKEIVHNPRAGIHNLQVDKLERELSADNLQKKLRVSDPIVSHEAKDAAMQKLKEGVKQGKIDLSDFSDLSSEAKKSASKAAGKGVRSAAVSDISPMQKLTETQQKFNDLMRSYGALGLVSGGVALTVPAYLHELKRDDNLKKSAADDTESMLSGAIGGAAIGAYSAAYRGRMRHVDAQSALTGLDALQGADPVEAEKLLKRIEEHPGYQYIKDIESVKKLREEVMKYRRLIEENATKPDAAKRLAEIEEEIKGLRFENPPRKGALRVAIDSLLDTMKFLSGKEPADKRMLRLKRSKKEVDKLLRQVQSKNRKIAIQMRRSASSGKIADLLSEASKDVITHTKPSMLSMAKGGLVGAALGAAGALVLDKFYQRATGHDKNISPYIAAGLVGGGAIGKAVSSAERKLASSFADEIIKAKMLPGQKKRELLLGFATLGKLPRTAEIASMEMYGPKVPFDIEKYKRALQRDVSGSATRDIDAVTNFGLAGGMFGSTMGMASSANEHAINQIRKEHYGAT